MDPIKENVKQDLKRAARANTHACLALIAAEIEPGGFVRGESGYDGISHALDSITKALELLVQLDTPD